MVGEQGDEGESPAAGGEVVMLLVGGVGETVAACVGDLDAESAGARQRGVAEGECEVAAGDVAVQDGVGGEFGDDEFGTVRDVRREAPGVEFGDGEQSGEAGASAGGRQLLAERESGGGELGSGAVHGGSLAVTGAEGREVRPVRRVSVRARRVDSTRRTPSLWVRVIVGLGTAGRGGE